MDCPHCGEPTLAGAVTCLSCRRPVLDFSAPPRARKAKGGAPAAETADSALCPICLGPVSVGTPGRLCAGCRGAPPPPAASADESLAEAVFRNRLGSKDLRPSGVLKRRTRVHRGVWAAALGLVFVIATLAVSVGDEEVDPVERHLHDLRAEPATWRIAVPADALVRYAAELDVSVRREYVQSSFSSDLSEDFDVRVRAEQNADVALAKGAGSAALLDVIASGRVVEKTGHKKRGDLSDVRVYPWRADEQRGWIGLGPDAPAGPPEDAAITVRDVPPFLTLLDAGAAYGELRPGALWETSLHLPFGAGVRGTLSNLFFRCDMTYLGKAVRHGDACTVTRLDGVVDANPDGGLKRFHRAHGQLRGVLFHSLETGLLREAALYVDTSVWREDRNSITDRVDLTGALTVARR